ncbi:MAG: ATP-binding protein [Nocardioides sp.]
MTVGEGVTSEPANRSAVARFALFAALTFLAATVGRSTLDASLGVSLVWPLYGVGVLWVGTGNRGTRPWDTLGLALVTAASVLVDDAGLPQVVTAMLMVVVTAWSWVLVAGWLNRARSTLARPRSLWDLVVLLVATAVSALVGAALRASGMGLVPSSDLETFTLLLIRNYSGILGPTCLGVLLLPYLGPGFRGRIRSALAVHHHDHRVRWAAEVCLMLAVTGWLTYLVFAGTARSLAFSLVLVVVWAAFRLPPVGAVAFALALGTAGVLATLEGQGQFYSAGDPLQSAATAQAFLITLLLATMAIAIDAEERRTATERARSAEQVAESRATLFSTVIEHLDEGVTVITADDDYTVRNSAARRLTGPTGFLGVDAGQPHLVTESGDPIPVSEMPHARARAESRVIRETVWVQLPSGGRRHLEVSSIPIPGLGEDARPVVVNTVRDVTQDQEERDQLVAFAGVVAHDLKNPLTVIRGWSESLQEELAADGPPDVRALRSMVERVQNASDQMTSFIDDLLGITVARDRPLDLEPLDLSALAGEVAELRRTQETQARIAVQPGMAVVGDRFLVRQLLDNLIGNAVKYVGTGTRPSVTVTATEVADELEVSITDNGIGIPVESRQRVFDSFVRAHGATYTGTGLGLAICSRVVSRHGGRIWVADHDGPGTRISFTLPRG